MWGETRADALRHMSSALASYQVAGLPNNLGFLARTVAHPAFAAGGVNTSFLGHHLPECLPQPAPAPPSVVALAALAVTSRFAAEASASAAACADPTSPWRASDASRPGLPTSASIALPFEDPEGAPLRAAQAAALASASPATSAGPAAAAGGRKGGKGAKEAALPDFHSHVRATVLPTPPPLPTSGLKAGAGTSPNGSLRAFRLSLASAPTPMAVSGTVVDVTAEVPARSAVPGFEAATTGRTLPGVRAYRVTAVLDGEATAKATVVTLPESEGLDVYVYPDGTLPGVDPASSLGRTYRLTLPATRFGKAGASGSAGNEVKTPMPGKVIKVLARPGDAVKEGQPLLILEAMKMETRIAAPRDGIVSKVHYAEGEFVEDGKVLVSFEEAPPA